MRDYHCGVDTVSQVSRALFSTAPHLLEFSDTQRTSVEPAVETSNLSNESVDIMQDNPDWFMILADVTRDEQLRKEGEKRIS